jgi:DNA (cytosine-5)-methyltransferase 1
VWIDLPYRGNRGYNRGMTVEHPTRIDSSRPVSVELCTGIGGLARGLHTAGWGHALLVERDPEAVRTLCGNRVSRHWPIHEGDLRELDLATEIDRPIDLLAAGVPCQPFSQGGMAEGDKDDRNLFPEVVAAVRTLRPKTVLIENVRGLTRPGFAEFLDYVSACLRRPNLAARKGEAWQRHADRLARAEEQGIGEPEENYVVEWRPFNLADLGVPQRRARVLIVAVREDLADRWIWPEMTHSREALIAAKRTGVYWERHEIDSRPIELSDRRIHELTTSSAALRKPWRTLRDAITDLGPPADDPANARPTGHYAWPGARVYRGHTGSDLDEPAKTIKAGVNGVPGGEHIVLLDDGSHRYMTVRECARVQGLPDTLTVEGSRSAAMRQIGNAVPPVIGEIFGRRLLRCVKEDGDMATHKHSAEQDAAAGSRAKRLIVDPADGAIRSASVELKQGRYASLRWTGGSLYLGRVEGEDRSAMLAAAFRMAREAHPEIFEVHSLA